MFHALCIQKEHHPKFGKLQTISKKSCQIGCISSKRQVNFKETIEAMIFLSKS